MPRPNCRKRTCRFKLPTLARRCGWAALWLGLCGLPAAQGVEFAAGPGGALTAAGAACQDCGASKGDGCTCAWWSYSGELLWLGRTNPREFPLLYSAFNAPAVQEANARELHFDVEAGVRTSLRWHPGSGQVYEFTYVGLFDQRDVISAVYEDGDVDPLNDLGYVFFNNAYGPSDVYTVDYLTDLNSAEANWYLRPSGRWTPFVGFRWVRLDEEFSIFETDNVIAGGFSSTTNSLWGAQGGVMVSLWNIGERWNVGAKFSGGVYQNDVELQARVVNAVGTVVDALAHDFNAQSYSGQIDVTASWRATDHLSVYAGYTGLFLSEMANAFDQNIMFNVNTGAGTLALSDIAYHGGHLGVVITW